MACGADFALRSSGVPSVEWLAEFAPGWALGGPLAAMMIVWAEDAHLPKRAQLANWILFVILSVLLAIPVGIAAYLVLQIRI